MAKKTPSEKNLKNGLALPDLKRFSAIKENFLNRKEQEAKIFARWELNFLWTRFREMSVAELLTLDIETLTVSEAIVVNQLRYILKTNDMTELNRVYDRLLGKPKEFKEEGKIIDDVEFTIDILKNPNEQESEI